ncbi:MAG: GyrI-like domain-containing protein [Ktedonobacteraceae bacterium]|nr:GyrI-like domain-containing protein [Ktedonobacteraceae bacterium]
MTNLIPIGRFAQITHFSIKALRIYADEGLLQPTYIDPSSGYRYYSLAQTMVAARIRLLRLIGMPLEEIRAVLEATDEKQIRRLLTGHQQRITDRMDRDQQSLLLLQWVMEKPDAFMSFTVKVKEVLEQPIVSICRQAAYGAFGQVIRSALRELLAYAIDAGIYITGQAPLVILHQSSPQQDREAGTDLQIGLPVQRTVDGERGIVSTMLLGGTVASVIHIGPYHELEIIYPALGAWIEEQGYVITGPPRNMILTNYASVSHPTEYQTEVMWPITRPAFLLE